MDESLVKIQSAIQKANARCMQFNKILVSISGGADSDVMLDMLWRVVPKEERNKLHFVFFNTGIEYKATLEHLDYLEKKYDIKIERERANIPVPLGCKKYGQPFLSKHTSQMIERLQRHNFDFKNDGYKSFDELYKKYPNNRSSLKWWCNEHGEGNNHKSSLNINNNKYLKEFMIEHPPTFKISAECCNGAKKSSSKIYLKAHGGFDLKCVGLRQAEGGLRASVFKNCYEFDPAKEIQSFRPIWWLTDKDKEKYDDFFKIVHSKCYTKYGMKRTGCAGCPFGSRFEEELEIVKEHEPMLYKAVNNIFGDSYEYTRAYRKFKEEMKAKEKQGIAQGQISIFDILKESD